MALSGPRRRAREAALQMLYAAEASHRLEPEAVERVADDVIHGFELPVRARQRALDLASGVACNRKCIDEAITEASTRWRIDRMAAVERNILRIAVYELLFEPGTPTEVILDEAIEIARRFAGESSPAFINGVLDSVARRRRERGA